MKINVFLILLLTLFTAFNVYGSLTRQLSFIKFFKPLLMPILIVLHINLSVEISYLLIAGLFFGWVGDIFLIKPEGFRFTGGLIAFLTGHIFYIVLLLGRLDWSTDILMTENIFLSFPYLAVGIVLMLRLKKNLGPMKGPVIIYMTCLILMSLSALFYFRVSTSIDFILPFAGSLLFLMSDSLLAFSTFKGEKKYSYSLVITTYAAAQSLITIGMSL